MQLRFRARSPRAPAARVDADGREVRRGTGRDRVDHEATITRQHCVEAKPGAYMCAYAIVRAGRRECHLMQGRWTPHAASTITRDALRPHAALRHAARRDPIARVVSVPRIEHELRIPTRWNDFDALGHLNHAAYHVYCDEARDAALRATVGDFETWPNVVAHASVDYRREIPLGTREVVVRTRIADVGRSSVRFEHDVADGAATVTAVLVAWDPATRRSREISDGERAQLST